ncbi:MAG: DUF5683 domain-containing protein [Limisphaerales bacterium]
MKKLFLFLLTFGISTAINAQTTVPDTTASDSLQAKPKTDTVIVKGTDTLAVPSVADTLVSGKKSNLRSPSGALLRSLAIPGWGQVYNKKYFKALIVAGGQGVLLGTAIVEWRRASDAKNDAGLPLAERLEDYRLHTNNRNMLLWLYAAATVVSMLDAYVDAHLSQDTGEGVPQIGSIILEPDIQKKALLLKLKIDF